MVFFFLSKSELVNTMDGNAEGCVAVTAHELSECPQACILASSLSLLISLVMIVNLLVLNAILHWRSSKAGIMPRPFLDSHQTAFLNFKLDIQ